MDLATSWAREEYVISLCLVHHWCCLQLEHTWMVMENWCLFILSLIFYVTIDIYNWEIEFIASKFLWSGTPFISPFIPGADEIWRPTPIYIRISLLTLLLYSKNGLRQKWNFFRQSAPCSRRQKQLFPWVEWRTRSTAKNSKSTRQPSPSPICPARLESRAKLG